MVAALLEIHHDVEEGDRLGASRVQLLKISGQDPAIVLPGMEMGKECCDGQTYTYSWVAAFLYRFLITTHTLSDGRQLLHHW